MVDEEKKENTIEEKIENAKIKLRGIVKEENIVYEKGKILFPGGGPILGLIFVILGFSIIPIFSLFFNKELVMSIAILSIIVGFVISFRVNYYMVLDYEKKMIYREKRDKENKSISKEIMFKPKELLAVGVNNHIGQGGKYDPGDLVTGELEESQVALLKSNGELVSLRGFQSKHYPNDCLISDAISILFDVPAVKCNKEQQLKVIKTGLNYKLVTEPLKRDSFITIVLKKIVFVVVGLSSALIFIMVLSYFLGNKP